MFDEFERIEKEIEEMRKRLEKLSKEMFKPLKIETISFPIDIRESNSDLIIEAELPGVNKENIDINLDENKLTIKAETKKAVEEKKEGYLHRERSYKSFYRSFTLPMPVIPEKAKATYKDGILTIIVPKKEKEKKKEVKIKIS
ncbi:MAG: Hsp20/alpha crystallin family protein [Candidatus Pacearchaeota archaeon]